MKRALPLLVIFASLYSLPGYSQLTDGGIFANFGVDADTRTNWVKYGPLTGAIASDDWFAPSGAGNNVIDTSKAATWRTLLSAGNNITFNQRMAAQLYAKVGGTLWIDAVYGRDFIAASTLKDATTYTISAKNGDNPIKWKGGNTNIPNKNDLADVYAHLRRAGLTVHDSLWFFTGVSTFGVNGSSYYDVELYKKTFTYNAGTGTFTTAGTEAGHTQWIFDAAGNITQTGDMIFAVSFSPGTAPVVDVRIWISQTTLSTITPAYFNFTGAFDGATTTPVYGYASIVSKTGTTAWGGGISNYSASATQDSTYSTPWGTANSSLGTGWDPNYETQQFIEIGMNLTRIGIDPALYSALGPCDALFSNIFFKSRSSTSFTSNLQDFMTPLTFTRNPVMDYSLKGDTIRCNHDPATISLTNNTTVGYYTWKALSGNMASANGDSSQLTVDRPGTYIVSASPAEGCPPTRTDTIVVPIDTFPPIASAFAGMSGNQLDFYGGDPVASNYPTPFGGSSGLTYNWTGPGGFTSTQQNPVTDTTWGTYRITVTEKRNGCTATASTTVIASMFTVLLEDGLVASGLYKAPSVSLSWENINGMPVQSYTIERMDANRNFQPLGTIAGSNTAYTDSHPLAGDNFYRIKASPANGAVYYSAVVKVAADPNGIRNVYLSGNFAGNMQLVANTGTDSRATLVVCNIAGQTLQKRDVYLTKGSNTIALPPSANRELRVIALFINDKIVFSQKVLF
jgi:hypothetical protein